MIMVIIIRLSGVEVADKLLQTKPGLEGQISTLYSERGEIQSKAA